MKCADCGMESADPGFFQTVRRSFSSKSRSLCPGCVAEKQNAVLKTMMWGYCGAGLAGLALILVFPHLSFGSLLLNMGFVLFAILGGTILHESGHAIAGMLAGHRIFYIEIGQGTAFLEFKQGRTRWRFRTILFGGLVQGFPKSPLRYRLKQFVFVLGGPAANAGAAFIAWKLLWLDDLLNPACLMDSGQ
jgi:hypothetical protein